MVIARFFRSSAMGGVVNVITRQSRGRIGGAARFGGGSYGTSDFSGRVGGSASSRVDFDLGGAMFDQVGRRPLPPWAAELGCANWAQYFLKWVIAHPAVTCAIPATRRPEHLDENMGAGIGALPDAAARQRMQSHIARL